MCISIVIYGKDSLAFEREISTIKEAAEFFGIESLRFSLPEYPEDDHMSGPVNPYDECCLCPIDVDFLLEKNGYVILEPEDSRYSYTDIVVEKA